MGNLLNPELSVKYPLAAAYLAGEFEDEFSANLLDWVIDSISHGFTVCAKILPEVA